jgi:hypothetical protein
MISKLINDIMTPIRSLFASARTITDQPAALKAQAKRIKQIPQEFKQQVGSLKDSAKAAGADAKAAKDKLGQARGAAQGAQASAQGAAAQAHGAVGQAQAAAGQGQAAPAQAKKAKKKMGLFGKKNVCPNCGQPQEKTWDKCPFCINMQGAMGGANPGGAPPAPAGGGATGAYGGFGAPPGGGAAQKTMMFSPGGAASGSGAQLGWVVPLKGPHKGELHTLKPQTVVGRDPTCDVCFSDTVMSSRHATIRASGGKFILEDHSTNGTYVNDKRITSQELVDNDFIKFGNTLVKFKSLT